LAPAGDCLRVPDDDLLWNCLLARGSLTMSYFGSGRRYAA